MLKTHRGLFNSRRGMTPILRKIQITWTFKRRTGKKVYFAVGPQIDVAVGKLRGVSSRYASVSLLQEVESMSPTREEGRAMAKGMSGTGKRASHLTLSAVLVVVWIPSATGVDASVPLAPVNSTITNVGSALTVRTGGDGAPILGHFSSAASTFTFWPAGGPQRLGRHLQYRCARYA